MDLHRVRVIGTNVFREVIRDRILYLIGLFALLLVAARVLLPEVAAGSQDKILLDLGLAAIELLGLVIAAFVGTTLVNKEIEKRTVFVMLTKPLSRAEFILGKHLGLSAVLLVLVTAMTLLYLGVLSLGQVSYSIGSILLAVLYQFLMLSLLTAVAIVFGVFTSSLLAALLTFAVYLMGQFSRDLLALGNLSDNAAIRWVTQGLYVVLPDLARLNLKNQAVYSIELLPSSTALVSNAAYALAYIGLLLTIAILVFSRREF